MDPITIISGATVAFNALKKGFAVGKDLQDMGSQLTKWAGHMADLGQAEKQVKNPPWWKSLGGSVEAESLEVFAAKRKAEAMRKELKDYISFTMGPSAWDELVAMYFKRVEYRIVFTAKCKYRFGSMVFHSHTLSNMGLIYLLY